MDGENVPIQYSSAEKWEGKQRKHRREMGERSCLYTITIYAAMARVRVQEFDLHANK